jgi:hypothetical protein
MSSYADRMGVDRRGASRMNADRMGSTLALLAAVLFAGSGCYAAHTCEAPEECNLRDDDCDGTIDEGFVDDLGEYSSIEACGTCGIDCRAVFPTAAEVACVSTLEGRACQLISCFEGFHRAGDGACVPDVNVLCLPCTENEDCAIRLPGTQCLDTATGARRCGQPCDASAPCPEGFSCELTMEGPGQCVPSSGICACTAATAGTEIACLLESPTGMRCAGIQRCGEDGPTACEPALAEACNTQDDDCDGEVDEDFVDASGRYVSRYHCGGCAMPCTEPGPNMMAECVAAASVTCEIDCIEGFVDVNRILADGCECERWDGTGPPPIIGGDADCDGIPDDTNDFVYVTTAGSDTNPGTLARPMRTINAASALARTERKDVLVARGVYEGPVNVVGGVSIYGGYAPDFSDRDLTLFPVLLERTTGEPGQPALVCTNITAATEIEGFVIAGSDAVREGEGSTAVTLDGCGPAVVLRAIEVIAGRGADGVRGDDSSVNLTEWGFGGLDELDGTSGGGGSDGSTGLCSRVPGGAGSRHSCGPGRRIDVSGGAGGAAECPGSICRNGMPCGNAGCTDFTSGGVCNLDAARRVATSNPAAGAGRGLGAGAAGELTYNAPTNRGVCNFCDDNPTLPREGQAGGDGAIGTNGSAGTGCSTRPNITSDGRVSGGDGTSGTSGIDGGGGGGGTAGGGYEVIGGTDGECGDRAGGSGGGGGSGGCGAPGADGGTGGGYAIGIFVRVDPASGRGPVFEDVRVVTSSAGDGADGGVGADGGAGGIGAAGGIGRFWCARTGGRGGDGGRGGAGGGGGGGCGGGSHGVFIVASGGMAYRDEVSASVMIEATGVAGRAGRGGFSPGAGGTDGSAGTAAPVFLTAP